MITVYVLPPQLHSNPYIDLLYGPFVQHAPDIAIRRGRPRQELLGLLLGHGPRILHLHFFDELTQRPSLLATVLRSLGFLLLLLLLRLRGVQIVWTAHNSMPHENYHPGWAYLVYRQVLRWSSLVITHSDAARAALLERYTLGVWGQRIGVLGQEKGRKAEKDRKPVELWSCGVVELKSTHQPTNLASLPTFRRNPARIPCQSRFLHTVIPHGHYIGYYGPIQERQVSRVRLGLAAQGKLTLCVGALRPYKNIEALIAAFASLPAQKRGTLLIVGTSKEPGYANRIRQQAAQVPGVSIDLRYIDDADMPFYLGAADLVALPYHRLLTSGVLLLALSYARPVLAPDLAAVRELIRDGYEGFLFEPGSTSSLAECLQRALSAADPARHEAYALACAVQFDWQSIAVRLAEQYRVVVGRAAS